MPKLENVAVFLSVLFVVTPLVFGFYLAHTDPLDIIPTNTCPDCGSTNTTAARYMEQIKCADCGTEYYPQKTMIDTTMYLGIVLIPWALAIALVAEVHKRREEKKIRERGA